MRTRCCVISIPACMGLTVRLAGVQTTDRFLRLSVELAVERCLASLDDPAQVAAKVQYLQVDALAQLVAVLLRYFDEWKQTTSLTKVTLFKKVLATVVKHVHSEHAERKAAFNQKASHRLLLFSQLPCTNRYFDGFSGSLAASSLRRTWNM